MKAKPILFNTEMVRAILDGRKMVTRRVEDIDTNILCKDGTTSHIFVPDNFAGGTPTGFVCRKCGFGVAPPHSRVPCGSSFFRPRYWPGDILYVRETWQAVYETEYDPNAPGYCVNIRTLIPNFGEIPKVEAGISSESKCAAMSPRMKYFVFKASDITFSDQKNKLLWRPSIHMPKEAARIFLRVTHVRLERLQAITADECPMEGVPLFAGLVGEMETYYKEAFAKLWDSTVKQADLDTYGWEANPWVWVIRFERCEKPREDTT